MPTPIAAAIIVPMNPPIKTPLGRPFAAGVSALLMAAVQVTAAFQLAVARPVPEALPQPSALDRLERLALSVDREVVNPVREPGGTAKLTLTGFYSDGSQLTLEPTNVVLTTRTRNASGNVAVVRLEGDRIVPLEGGIATIEAVLAQGGRQLKAAADVVVRPFYRDYHQTLVMKLFLGMEGEPVERLAKEPMFQKKHDVLCTFEEALQVIRKTDNVTRGIPKIIYLVGWQKGGHDHGYPAWSEVNPRLKRAQDATALESLRWLIREAKRFHTTVSLHLNMVDAYKQSPLWDEYVANDCFARDMNGELLVAGIQMKGEEMYNVVYPREWEAGLAQRRIDRLIEMIPELRDGHTIHIDVFIAQREGGQPISPWHAKPENGGLSPASYVETQRKIFKYWRERGFDVTGEGIFWAHPPGEGFTGLQAMSWWYPGDPGYQMSIPECLMARGRTDRGGDGDFRFGSSMHGEEIWQRDKDRMPGFLGMFCRTTLPWYYLSRLERLKFENGALFYSDGVVARTEEGKRVIRQGAFVLRENDDLFIPALWNRQEIIAFSQEGYENRSWLLPKDWSSITSVDLYRIGMEGCVPLQTRVPITEAKLVLSLAAGEAVSIVPAGAEIAAAAQPILKPEKFQHYIEVFNREDRETVTNHIPNATVWSWMATNVPLFECPDRDLEKTYYFRWWTYRKHIKQTPDGFVVTEFLPKVSWSKKHNTINCPVGHHLYEGRWIRDPRYLDDYTCFYFGNGGDPGGTTKVYSQWLTDAIYARYLVNRDDTLVTGLLDEMVKNHEAWSRDGAPGDPWQKSRLLDTGLYWQIDSWEGGEVSIGGTGVRPMINSYLYGDALALAHIAELAGRPELADRFRAEAEELRKRFQEQLWDPDAKFFKVLRHEKVPTNQYPNPAAEDCAPGRRVKVREIFGYIPWYFNLPEAARGYEEAWRQLTDPQGFLALHGPTVAERRHPNFTINQSGCEWRGASWPFATAQTLTALANLLNHYDQGLIGKNEYFDLLTTYARSHRRTLPDGTVVCWIDESLNPDTGAWIPTEGDPPRGKDYNHSTFCDLVISGLVGLRPRADNTVEVNPLVPEGTWDYFCLDRIKYHGQDLTIFYDKTGGRYGRGNGLQVLANGRRIAGSESLQRVTGMLPDDVASAAWERGQRANYDGTAW